MLTIALVIKKRDKKKKLAQYQKDFEIKKKTKTKNKLCEKEINGNKVNRLNDALKRFGQCTRTENLVSFQEINF